MRDYSFLLDRAEWTFPEAAIDDYFRSRRVLVTGAGGSIGSAVVRRLLGVAKFVGALGNSELPLFHIKDEVKSSSGQIRLADVRGPLDEVFKQWKPDVVIHAAAHKHVELMEAQPMEAFNNNVYGTLNTAATADRFGVEKFVFISTDKSAKPSCVMGASKRLAEYALMASIRPVVVRFGNVLGSSGSLVEIMENCIAEGKPVTITHRDMVRYFITSREAVGLVLTSAACLPEKNIYSLDMGAPVKIADVAKKFFEFRRGMAPNIVWGNPTAGEKLVEDLTNPSESISSVKGYSGFRRIRGQVYDMALWRVVVENFHAGNLDLVKAANLI